MSPGAVVAIGAWSAVVLLVLYGVSFDARRWLANRREQRLNDDLERAWELPCAPDPRRLV